MARKSLRPQLNQIRAWVRQGRTEAWIAHQLEVSSSQLRDFIKRNGLEGEGEETAAGELDLRDEIEAEIEAELDEADSGEVPEEPEEADDEDEGREDEDEDGKPARRRRRRRGGRGRSRGRRRDLEGTFDHGDKDGYGLWLDPAVKDDPVYAEHWAKTRQLKVTIEPERIVLERQD
jgi:hypothetical protein